MVSITNALEPIRCGDVCCMKLNRTWHPVLQWPHFIFALFVEGRKQSGKRVSELKKKMVSEMLALILEKQFARIYTF